MNDDAWRRLKLHELLDRLSGRLSPRKARLIACACVREAPGGSRTTTSEAVLLAEQFADGLATFHQLASARFGGRFQPGHFAWPVCWSPDVDQCQMMQRALAWVTGLIGFSPVADFRRVEARLADIVRDVAGNPYRPPAIDPNWVAWNDGTVGKLARAIYNERAYDQMPILGDALEEASCADPSLLDHCRFAGRHYRGCWLLDTILGLG